MDAVNDIEYFFTISADNRNNNKNLCRMFKMRRLDVLILAFEYLNFFT